MKKSSLRQTSKEWINGFGDQKSKLDQLISQQVHSLIHYFKTDKQLIIGAYKPLKDEVVWNKAFDLDEKILVSYPEMTLENSLVYKVGDQVVEPSLLLVPGLMFSENGYRLGRGGGYFDRFLKEFKGVAVGVIYTKWIGEIPVESHDIPVHGVVTEAGWRIYKSEES